MELLLPRADTAVLHNRSSRVPERLLPTSSCCKRAFRRRDSKTSTHRTHQSLTRSRNRLLQKSIRSSSAGALQRRLPTTSSSLPSTISSCISVSGEKFAVITPLTLKDDSGSMQFEEEGSRIKDLRLILERVSFAATLFDQDGISLRFMNTDLSGMRDQSGRPLQDGVATEAQIEQIMRGVQFKGLTPMGTSLRKKVIDEIVLQKAASGQLRKPVLVIAITDGQPAGEPQNAVFDTIRYAFDSLQQRYPQYGRGGIAFEFAQVGNDEMARKFLGKLDEDPNIGPMVDCTSSTSLALQWRCLTNMIQTSRTSKKKCPARTLLSILHPTYGSSSSFSAPSTAATMPRTRRPTTPLLAAMVLPVASTAHPHSKVTASSLLQVNMALLRQASTAPLLKVRASMALHHQVSTANSDRLRVVLRLREEDIPVSNSTVSHRQVADIRRVHL
jgi:hypothetical protein